MVAVKNILKFPYGDATHLTRLDKRLTKKIKSSLLKKNNNPQNYNSYCEQPSNG